MQTDQEGSGGFPDVELRADLASSFTYASFQNAIPVVRSIAVRNSGDASLSQLTLELVSAPPFLRPKTWTIDRIMPGDEITLSDRKIDLDAGYLAGLNEAERGTISLTLSEGGNVLCRQEYGVRLLARDEWGGVAEMVQLLPAFVMPNDPGVAKVLKGAAEQLAAHGHFSGMDGYQSQSPQRGYMLVAAIYSAIAGLRMHYAEPPASFELRGQKIRRPSVQIGDGLATCLDISVLFAAAFEAAGLNAVLLLFQGHAAVGVWLTKRNLANTIETDAMEIRKAVASKELLIFETTVVTHRPPMPLQAACDLLKRRLDDEENTGFNAAIDIQRARSGGIMPLASHEPAREAATDEEDSEGLMLPLPQIPDADSLPAEVAEDIKPTTAAGRIDRWQKKLLDLTLRNRLLSFPDSQKTIPFLCTNVSDLEDRLAAGKAIHVISLPEQNPLGERDAALYRDVRGRDIHRDFAIEALERNELTSPLNSKELESRLIELHRQVRNDLAEGGTNTLFLAVGFLRWKKKPEDDRAYRAPLLLVPVKLERRSASSRFTLGFHEDEPRFNATLLQFLERDFDLKLPQFGGELPTDHSGIDVPRVLGMMRQAVRNVPGMEVLDETALSTFSFAKFLMWKDLTERTDALRQNRVVRHLIDTPDKAFDAGGPFRDGRELDTCPPSQIISLLPADSSQIAASMAAAEGRDFVIIGPPGTGKSQTIANMIANCLAAGKTVLFVAEKTAALDVVYRRLREHGLGDHCLELHSNKADRKHFISQLRKSWESGARDASAWVEINEKLRVRRDELNAYVAALHRPARNGLTPFAAMGIALKSSGHHAPALSWPQREAHETAERTALAEMAAELGRVWSAMERRPVLVILNVEEWSSAWQDSLTGAEHALREAAAALVPRLETFTTALGLPPQADAAPAELERLNTLAGLLRDNAGSDYSVMFDPDFLRLRPALNDLDAAITAYQKAESSLSVSYARADMLRVPVEALDAAWRQAVSAFWPLNLLKQGVVRKQLGTYAGGAVPKPETDLPLLRQMQAQHQIINESLLSRKAVAFKGLDTSIPAIDRHLAVADQLRDGLRRWGGPELSPAVFAALTPPLSGNRDHPVFAAAVEFAAGYATYSEALRHFTRAANTDSASSSDAVLDATVQQMDDLLAARHLLRDWAVWCAVRNRARNRGLEPLVADLEAGHVASGDTEAAFHLAYARWWLPLALDADPVLRQFRRFQHEHAIDDFRHIDDMVRAAASARVISSLAHTLPAPQGVPRNSELGLLRHQMELQRPSRAIRELISALPTTFGKLAPCMLMSPLSIAQYLPPDQALFDVVIFDEASQITTWDAVGAIARGRQTIIVGDPKQLPPTNFFGRNDDDGDGAVPDHEQDLESILDEAKASGIPLRDLRWHYRSRNESLIAFSNHYYYQNRLITFPSPSVEDRAVQLRPVRDGVYDRGKSRTNAREARAVADEAIQRMRQWLPLPADKRPTLGIITFNSQQQSLITDLLDQARRDHPALEWFFAEDRTEPAIVKNLENVQGDERDVILFSITFWKDAAGKLTMDFGALNREGGERRLNVAVTRARQELIVFSGFTADQIDTTRTKALGAHHLKAFLDFAERGAAALPGQAEDSQGEAESPFEDAVTAALEAHGWHVIPQVGVSGFRIDIGVRHPDKPGAYLAGVECDGAAYHSAATARDRDKVREQVLRGLGWNILRVWSTDWWFGAAGATGRLHDALTRLLDESRQKDAEIALVAEAPVVAETPVAEDIILPQQELMAVAENPAPVSDIVLPVPMPETKQRVAGSYSVTDLSDLNPAPERFHDFDYRHTLKAMIDRIIETEAPVRSDILAQRIARAHGWLRTGGKIRERIDLYMRDVDRTQESSGEFVWKKGSAGEAIVYRPAGDDDSRRGIADISLAELTTLVRANQDILLVRDPALELARLMGVERLTASSRARLEEALACAQVTGNDA